MAKKLNGKRRFSILKVFLVVGGGVLVAFLVWLVATVLMMDASFGTEQTYSLPTFKSLGDLKKVDDRDWAVAIDGEAVAGKNYGSDAIALIPTASTAKMILGLAVMEKKPFNLGEAGETIIIDQAMYERYAYYLTHDGSNSKVALGEEISEYDALMSVFLVSSNNMADSLAIWAFGSLEGYRAYAADMLKGWGLSQTEIGIDASGFDASTVSTAEELAKIGQRVLENPVLAEIVGTKTYTVPVAGELINTNQILGRDRIVGVKTGFIGEASGYCLISGYREGEHIITVAVMRAPTRAVSFDDSLKLVQGLQEIVPETKLVSAGEVVGYYDSWWTGPVKITADQNLAGIGWSEASMETNLAMDGETGVLKIKINDTDYQVPVTTEEYSKEPSLGEKLAHAFGWQKTGERENDEVQTDNSEEEAENTEEADDTNVSTNTASANCTIKLGALMLINPNFTVEESFIADRKTELVSLASLYGIVEGNAYNGDNLLDAEAAAHINEMVNAYKAEYPGHTLETRSCFRMKGTNCGRLCAATGASDHHTGLTCDLVDPTYGDLLDTDTYSKHPDWQWLKANSYKYGFIDRFPEAWAGGPMSEPLNVDENGSTGLYETWHYRYVGVKAATEIATGKYNNGQYDSLEHYLKARGLVADLKSGTCE